MTEEDIWKGDLLGRKEEGLYLLRYIVKLYELDKKDETSFVLNINSEWGHGKTWFLKNLYKELKQNHPIVYFDAWKNDFTKDALLSFVSVICDELSQLYWKKSSVSQKITKVKTAFSLISKNALPILASVLVKQLTGKALEDIELSDDTRETFIDASEQLSKVVGTSMIDGFIAQKNAIDNFSNAIQSLVHEIEKDSDSHLPICIIIDELDRCRPTYAIELLEAVKHLFSVKGIFFILATDTQQLSHSIKAVYGQGFNASAYLKRFFYAEYNLTSPNYSQIAKSLFDGSSVHDKMLLPLSLADYGVIGMFSSMSEFFQLNIRDQKQVFFVLETIVLTSSLRQFHFLFLTFLICMRHKFVDDYKRLEYIRRPQELRQIISNKMSSSELKDLHIKSIYWERGGGSPKEFKFRELVETYLDFLVQDLSDLEHIPGQQGFDWINEARVQIINTIKLDGPIEYFDVVNQSGKISVLS